MTRYYKECETCKEDMQRAYCNYCEKLLVEVTEEVEAMRQLLSEFAERPYSNDERRLMERAWDILGIEYTKWSDEAVNGEAYD